MARIKTDRPEAMAYNGRDAKFVRDVIDGPAYSRFVDQVIVEIDGLELYFFANEVTLSEGEEKGAKKARDKQAEASAEAVEAGQANIEGKKALLASYKRGAAPLADADKPIAGGGGIAPMSIPAHAGSTPAQVAAGVNPQNPVPGSPRKAEEPGQEIGPGGYPAGSGPDPQGRRVNEKDQSKSNPSERPVPKS